MQSIKDEWSLIPLYLVMTVAMSGVVYYCGRLAFSNECVAWKKQDEPWNYYSDKEFKIIKQGTAAHKTCVAPDYKSA